MGHPESRALCATWALSFGVRTRHHHPVDVGAIAEAAIRLVELTRKGHVSIVSEVESAWALAVPHRLEQVLVNLLVNALDATDEDSPHPSVTIRTSDEPGGVVVEVEDRGNGDLRGRPLEDLESLLYDETAR